MNFDSRYIWDALPLLMQGLQLTLIISLSGLLGGLIIGLLAGTCRALGGTISKTVSLVFVEVIRGTPIMVQVMFIYFALPMVLPVRIDPVPAAIITIVINSGAYIAEITRGAILSINKGFKEASLAMGLSPRSTLWHVIMPLAFRRMIPALGNQWIISIKDTSRWRACSVAELTRQGQEIIAGNFRALDSFICFRMI
ncbi:glutamine ABC transporter permease GlnP [Klebsiella quasipneumoniae subsp. quasipneumoniae]|nr:glutamine ABC transporter permease GlnP [Klebsiella quasipneumoniae subsp. quasipneumoniae]